MSSCSVEVVENNVKVGVGDWALCKDGMRGGDSKAGVTSLRVVKLLHLQQSQTWYFY